MPQPRGTLGPGPTMPGDLQDPAAPAPNCRVLELTPSHLLPVSTEGTWCPGPARPPILLVPPGLSQPLSLAVSLQAWLTEIHEYAQQDVVLMLLGNKVSPAQLCQGLLFLP